MTQARSEDPPPYRTEKSTDQLDREDKKRQDGLIAEAIKILETRVRTRHIHNQSDVKNWFRLRSAALEHEMFSIMFLDAQHCFIECEDMFRGSVSQCSVYPREVVKRALELNASAVILSHNHPSGCAEPSRADEFLTTSLKNALAMVDVRVLDHIVVGNGGAISFSERGLL